MTTPSKTKAQEPSEASAELLNLNLGEDLYRAIKARLASPIAGTFLVFVVIVNWDFVAPYIFSNETLKTIGWIPPKSVGLDRSLWLPFGLTAFYLIVYPWLGNLSSLYRAFCEYTGESWTAKIDQKRIELAVSKSKGREVALASSLVQELNGKLEALKSEVLALTDECDDLGAKKFLLQSDHHHEELPSSPQHDVRAALEILLSRCAPSLEAHGPENVQARDALDELQDVIARSLRGSLLTQLIKFAREANRAGSVASAVKHQLSCILELLPAIKEEDVNLSFDAKAWIEQREVSRRAWATESPEDSSEISPADYQVNAADDPKVNNID